MRPGPGAADLTRRAGAATPGDHDTYPTGIHPPEDT